MIQNYGSHIPNAFIIIGPQLKKCTEVITPAVVLRNVGGTAAVIFTPCKHPQFDIHSSHMAVCKQVANARICPKVVIGLCKSKQA
jgi:hypothetical protein